MSRHTLCKSLYRVEKYWFLEIAEIVWWTHEGAQSFPRKRMEHMAWYRTFSDAAPLRREGGGRMAVRVVPDHTSRGGKRVHNLPPQHAY